MSSRGREPESVALADVAAACELSEDELLRRSLAEGWHECLHDLAGGGYGFRTSELPVDVLGAVLQWLAWGRTVPPRFCEEDVWGKPFHYDRRKIWNEFAALSPRLRERGRVRMSALAMAEHFRRESGGEFRDAAAKAAAHLREDYDVVYRIEGVTAEQIEEWSDEEAGVRRFHPLDWLALVGPFESESEDPAIPRWAWEAFAIHLLGPDIRFPAAAAHAGISRFAEERGLRLPPLEAFERRARNEFTRELLKAARDGLARGLSRYYDRRARRANSDPELEHELESWEEHLAPYPDPGLEAGADPFPPERLDKARKEFAAATIEARIAGRRRAGAVLQVAELVRSDGLSIRSAACAMAEWFDDRGFSASSIRRWHAICRAAPASAWPALLTPLRGGGPGKKAIHPEALEFLRRDYLDRHRKPSFALSCDRTRKAARAKGWGSLPSNSTLRRRFRDEVPSVIELLIREGGA